MSVEVVFPEEFQGLIMGQLVRRHGIVTGTDGYDGWTSIYAEVPLNDMFGYAGEVRLVFFVLIFLFTVNFLCLTSVLNLNLFSGLLRKEKVNLVWNSSDTLRVC